MFLILGNPKTINALNGHFDVNVGKLRAHTKVCVIDDEAFPKKNMLSQHEYQIREIGDIKDINAVHVCTGDFEQRFRRKTDSYLKEENPRLCSIKWCPFSASVHS